MRRRSRITDYIQGIISFFWFIGTIIYLVGAPIIVGCFSIFIIYTSIKFIIAESWSIRYICAIIVLIFSISIFGYFLYIIPSMFKFLKNSVKEIFKKHDWLSFFPYPKLSYVVPGMRSLLRYILGVCFFHQLGFSNG